MKIRCIEKPEDIGESSNFNVQSLNEIMVYFDDWMDTDYPKNYEVYIEAINEWISFSKAWKEKHIINDNYNKRFFEPDNDEDRERGFTL